MNSVEQKYSDNETHRTSTTLYSIRMQCGTQISLTDLENASISYIPCNHNKPFFKFGKLWDEEKQITLESFGSKNAWTLANMQGVQIFTGRPTHRKVDDITFYLIDIDIEKRLIDEYPTHLEKILCLYHNACDRTPTEIRTKSGGRRLSAFCDTLGAKVFYKDKQAHKDDDKTILLEFFSRCGLSRIDNRYSMLSGSLLDIPIIPKSALHQIRAIIQEIGDENQTNFKASTAKYVDLDNLDIHDLDYDDKGKSQYLPARYCPLTEHKDINRATVRYVDFGKTGQCFNCGGSWKTITEKPTPIDPKLEQERIQRLIEQAPQPEIREQPSYPYFTPEQTQVVEQILNISASAGWHGHTPVWTPKYEYLNKLIPNKFAMNGQPSEVERRRVWTTLVGKCNKCGGDTVMWVDRYNLTAGCYCDKEHKDYYLGSYLELELNRKLRNSIISDYQGYIANDPNYQDFRLWQPGLFTNLGAVMGSGKTTIIIYIARLLASQGIGRTIIAVPRISLARFLAHFFRKEDGHNAWGLWHEGVSKGNKFIGSIGAFVCLPSLPSAVKAADGCQLHIAIDEIDFAYQLTGLAIEQATAIKKCLREHLHRTGLVVIGQTESTLALEGLIEELEPETYQGFYNTAPPSHGQVTLHKIENNIGKQNALLAAVADKIEDVFTAGKTPYVFCSSRRDAAVLAEFTKSMKPLVYNAYTKLFTVSDGLLKKQKIPEPFGLFIGTSAADVGISINDPNAHTFIASGLNHSSRQLPSVVQEAQRVRNKNDIDIFYTDYNFSLPVAPQENENAAFQHEAIKQAFQPEAHMPTGAIKKKARAQALQTLADTQPETFIKYHLGTTANMRISEAAVIPPDTYKIKWIQTTRKELIKAERTEIVDFATKLLHKKTIMPLSHIRREHVMRVEFRMAHELAAKIAIAIGWNEDIDLQLSEVDTQLAINITQAGITPETLTKQRRGYLATHHPDFVRKQLTDALMRTTSEYIEEGQGRELTAIKDDLGIGDTLTALLNALQGKIWTEQTLAATVLQTLQETGLLEKLQSGNMGTTEFKRSRFLHCTPDLAVVKWTRNFIPEWYPMRIARNNGNYTLAQVKDYRLKTDAFTAYLKANEYQHVPAHNDIETVPLPDPEDTLKNKVRRMRYDGETLKTIANQLGKSPQTVLRWCKGVKTPLTRQKETALNWANYGITPNEIHENLTLEYAEKTAEYRTILRWLKN